MTRARRRLLRATGLALAAPLALLFAAWVFAPDPEPLLARGPRPAIEVVDRWGGLLRYAPSRDGLRYAPVCLAEVSPHLPSALISAEDRRFRLHPGVDPVAAVRAAVANARAGRIVSGGSTLTMQLARVLDPRPRGWGAKLRQVLLAIRLEASLDKDEILEAYLSRAPMGNRIVGFEAASRVYFGKPARFLSPAEAALLAAVPRSPSAENPWKGGEDLRRRRDAILRRMADDGKLDGPSLAAALAEPVVLLPDAFRSEAEWAVRRVLEDGPEIPEGTTRIDTTIEPELQRRVSEIARRKREELAVHGVGAVSVAVLDVRRGEWLALEGAGAPEAAAAGGIDGTRAPRQPGSALKPFTYAAAFEGDVTPATLLPDLPRSFAGEAGTWIPRNYDEEFHGPVRAREALACSMNVPAAVLLDRVGPSRVLDFLRRAGVTTLDRDPSWYGLGLTLGGGEVRLDELTNAFAALLRGGVWRSAAAWRRAENGAGDVVVRPDRPPPRRVCAAEAAAEVVDILADPEARAPAFGAWSVLRLPFPAAVKTGTSEGFRDNWTVGGTRDVVVGVWCGSFDRSPMGNVSGVTGAGAVWREVMLAWEEIVARGRSPRSFAEAFGELPDGLRRVRVCALSGMAAGPHCPRTVAELARKGLSRAPECTWHRREGNEVRIAWPPLYRQWAVEASGGDVAVADAPGGGLEIASPSDGDAFQIAPDLPRRFQTVELRAIVSGTPPVVEWRIDGATVTRAPSPYGYRWAIEPGEHRIEAIVGGRRSKAVRIVVYGG